VTTAGEALVWPKSITRSNHEALLSRVSRHLTSLEGIRLGIRIARSKARDSALGSMALAIAFAITACSAAQSQSSGELQQTSTPSGPTAPASTPLVSVAPSFGPTLAPTFDSAQVETVRIRALAVDGDVVYGDQHVGDKYSFVAYDLKTGTRRDLGTAADAAAVSNGRLVWTTFTIERGGGGGPAVPGCGWSVAHWRMYRLFPSDAKPTLIAKGDSYRPGWGMCADSMPPLIAFDGTSVAFTDGWGAAIVIIDVGSGRRKRTIVTTGTVDALAMSNGSIAYLEGSDSSGEFNDHDLMVASLGGAPKVQQRRAAWMAMNGGRIAWISLDTSSGAISTRELAASSAVDLPTPFAPVDGGANLGPRDSLIAVSADAVAWSWPSDRNSIAYWGEGQVGGCLIPTPRTSGIGLVYPISVGSHWLVWTDGVMTRPEEWQDNDDPSTYAAPIAALKCP
jgi:hypothetical protein